MLQNFDTQLAAAEHCDALQQCDDDGCLHWIDRSCLRRHSRRSRHAGLEKKFREGEKGERQGKEGDEEGTTSHLRQRLHLLWGLRSGSMGERGNDDCNGNGTGSGSGSGCGIHEFCFTFTFTRRLTFTLTLVSLPFRRFGMNRRVSFTLCITLDFPYRVMSLHCTIDTAIRAVDDNQIGSPEDHYHHHLRWACSLSSVSVSNN